jgi:excinuclease ABC subunit B
MEMLEEVGFVKGIENYSYYLSGRQRGEPPFTLIDYFSHVDENFLTIIDESHITIPQVGGMYGGDASRKQNLVEHGFRLPSAADNRPLKFPEFEEKVGRRVYVSATPGPYEFRNSTNGELERLADVKRARELPSTVVEQIIRPTGLLEPPIELRATANQVQDLIEEVEKVTAEGHRTLVVTLTKRMAEDISEFLRERDVRSEYLHSEIDTLERPKILNRLRKGEFDVLIGINLLREGLDLPEVALVAILDADQEGFLRNETSLIQTIGRAARHEEGRVILYADKETKSIQNAIAETQRRRATQQAYNEEHNISPEGIRKEIHPEMVEDKKEHLKEAKKEERQHIDPEEQEAVIAQLEEEMKEASRNLNFERAAELRDEIEELKGK